MSNDNQAPLSEDGYLWEGPLWSDEAQLYYHYRIDENDEYVYRWLQSTPRTSDPDVLAAGINSMSLDPPDSEAGPSSSTNYTLGQPSSSKGKTKAIDVTTGDVYRREHSSRFQPGEVFKLWWSEPTGRRNDDPLTVCNPEDDFYVGPRRFIVIASDHGNSTCVPILTYERRGCTKGGVRADKHGIAHSSQDPIPNLLPGEPGLGYPPVAIDMTCMERFEVQSRINYAKLQTIEHNAPVIFIGSVAMGYFGTVSEAVDQCWYQKKKKPKSSGHKHRSKK